MISAPAICTFHCVNWLPERFWTATVTGRSCGSLVMIRPNRNSFQSEVNCQIATTTKPGTEIGSIIWRYNPKKSAPSILPASSSSVGTPA
jgi:hypothetical protein